MDSVFIFLCHTAGTALSLVIGFLFMKVLDCCLVRRHGKLVSLIGILGYGMVSTTVIFPQDMLNICFIVILFLLLNSILYKGKWVIKLSLIVILFPIFTALNFLSFDVTGKIFFQFYTMQDKLENAFFSNSQYLILIPFWLFFYRYFRRPLEKIRDIFTNQAWGITCVVCMASFIALFSCVYLSPFQDSYFVWPCMMACIIANIGSIHLASYLADGLYANLERKNLQLQQTYYTELEKNQRQIRKLRHDIQCDGRACDSCQHSGNNDTQIAHPVYIDPQCIRSGRLFAHRADPKPPFCFIEQKTHTECKNHRNDGKYADIQIFQNPRCFIP